MLTTVCTLVIPSACDSFSAVKGLLGFPTAQVAIDVFCLCLASAPFFAVLLWLLVFVCVSRYALLAWGSAFRLYVLICHLALYRLGHRFSIHFDVQY